MRARTPRDPARARRRRRRARFLITFLSPAIVLYSVFVLWPYAQSFYIALTQWRGVSANRTFIGLANFEKLVSDPNFWNALGHNGLMLIALPAATIGLALFFAALFAQGGRTVRGAGFYRVVFFAPQVMSVVAIGLIWSFVFHPTIGLLNGALSAAGLDGLKRTWLGDPDTVLWAIALVVVWQAVGFYMVLFIAGMQAIPMSLYEAATLDGASRWQAFWRITLPLLWGHVRTALVFISIGALDLFAIVQVMTRGGPNRASDVVALFMYETAFSFSDFGYATAIGVALLLMTLTLAVLMLKATQREHIEY
ncbi:MAG: N-acetylglucosamine transport system permease protein [Chloroflexota bacterium]|jgi:N-acetylglucosamine transport system permease protein|nr:N-acetylglucosamine transport system permease protein [Chloroflexota bacterium]